MGSRALPAPGPKKCKTESKKSQKRLFFNYFDSFLTLFWTFWAPGPKGPGNPFSNSICNSRPEGPNDPCSGQKFSQKKGFYVFQYNLAGKDGSGSGLGSRKTVPAVPVPLSVSGKTVPTVPVSGSGSVPEPPCRVSVKTNFGATKTLFLKAFGSLKNGLD